MSAVDLDRPVVDADGRVLHAPNPPRLSDVVDADGLLTLGGSWASWTRHAPDDPYDLHVQMCKEYEAVSAPPAWRHVYLPMGDDATVRHGLIDLAVVEVVAAIGRGERVVVTCYTGQNRSGVVVALAYCQLTGVTGREAIDHLRAVRSSNVLCNPAYEAHVLATYPAPEA